MRFTLLNLGKDIFPDVAGHFFKENNCMYLHAENFPYIFCFQMNGAHFTELPINIIYIYGTPYKYNIYYK